MIEFDGVQVVAENSLGEPHVILGPVTAEFGERRISVVGANGSGKSTLVRAINGLASLSAGQVLVDGVSVGEHAARVRTQVAMMFADPSAQVIMATPVEDVALSLRRSVKDKHERHERAMAALARVGLATVAEVPVMQLSAGQRQLLAFASVLAVEPAVIVLDEPTTLLDLHWATVVDALIDDVAARGDVQVIEVTHDLTAAARAERTVVIDGGLIVSDGAPSDALAVYRELMTARAAEAVAGA